MIVKISNGIITSQSTLMKMVLKNSSSSIYVKHLFTITCLQKYNIKGTVVNAHGLAVMMVKILNRIISLQKILRKLTF